MPDPLDATKRMDDVSEAGAKDAAKDRIVAKALAKRRKRKYPSPAKVAADCGARLLKMAGPFDQGDAVPMPQAEAEWNAAPPGDAVPMPQAEAEWDLAKPRNDAVPMPQAEAEWAAAGAPNTSAGGPAGGDAQGWMQKLMGMPGKAWGQWSDTGLAQSSPLAKYGIPAAGGGLLAYMLYKMMRGGNKEKRSYDKLAEFPGASLPSLVGSIQNGCQYGTSALPSTTSQSTSGVRTDSDNGWSSSRVKNAGCKGRKKKGEGYHKAMMVKEGNNPAYMAGQGAAQGGLMGAGAGGLAGAGMGALFPGQDEEGEDRSRLMEGMKGGLMGAGIGAGVGGFGGAAHGYGAGQGLEQGEAAINDFMQDPAMQQVLQQMLEGGGQGGAPPAM